MKKILIVLPLVFMACKKKEVTQNEPTNCNCYKTIYHKGAGGNYFYDSQTTPFVDLCVKNGTTEYSETGIYKTVWTCN